MFIPAQDYARSHHNPAAHQMQTLILTAQFSNVSHIQLSKMGGKKAEIGSYLLIKMRVHNQPTWELCISKGEKKETK